jgi:hypothetical protein
MRETIDLTDDAQWRAEQHYVAKAATACLMIIAGSSVVSMLCLLALVDHFMK